MQVYVIYPDGKGGERRVPRAISGESDMYAVLGEMLHYNVGFLRAHPDFPLLYDAYDRGLVHYEKEPSLTDGSMREDWQTAPINLLRGSADCEDLAAHRAAELIVSGQDPGARPYLSRQRHAWGSLWHVRVWRTKKSVPGVGSIDVHWLEDPSAVVGMQGSWRQA